MTKDLDAYERMPFSAEFLENDIIDLCEKAMKDGMFINEIAAILLFAVHYMISQQNENEIESSYSIALETLLSQHKSIYEIKQST